MDSYRQMVRQLLAGRLSCNVIAEQRGMSHNTVRRARDIAKKSALTVEALDAMSDQELRALFYARAHPKADFVIPDWDAECAFVRRGFSRMDAYAHYSQRVGPAQAMAYRTYCEKLLAHTAALAPVLRITHVPGYALQTDFAGYMPEARDNEGDLRHYKLFVATLPYSRLIAAALVASEKVADHIAGNISALEYIGGVPTVLVPDNLKAAVTSRRGGLIRLNDVYKAFLDHYGTGATPARPRRPQDKPAVENAVKLIQRSLRRWLIDRPTPSIADLRQALAGIVDEWNARPMRRANGHSRRTLFEQEELQHLQPMPGERFECFEAVRNCRIGKDYHVQFKGSYYSVPHSLIGKTATLRASATTMRIFVDGLQVAVHPRVETVGAASTNREHLTKEQAGYISVDLVEWARHYPQPVGILAAAEMERSANPQMRTRRSRWIKDLPRIHSRQRFITACERAVSLDDLRFEHVENVLKRGIESSTVDDRIHQTIRPGHNVRSPSDFSDGREESHGA